MKKLTLTLALIPLVAIAALAQTPTRLTLADAIELAVNQNRDIKNARLTIDNADAQVEEAYSNALPNVGLNGRYTQNLKKQVVYFPLPPDYKPKEIAMGQNIDLTAELTVNQIIFNRAVFTGVGTAKTYEQIAKQQLRVKTADVVLNVRRAYLAAQLAQEVLHVNETMLDNSRENYRTTNVLYKAGLRPEFDAIRAEVQMSNQEPAVVQARDNYRLALDNLRLLLGMDVSQPIEIADSLVRPASLAESEPRIEEASAILERFNPTLQTLGLNTELNREIIDIRKSDYLPTVALFGSFKYNAQADKLGDLSFNPIAYAGINLSVNLFNGFRTDAQVKQAEVAVAQSQETYSQVTQALKTQLEATLRRIESARSRIGVSEKTIQQAEKGYRIATTSYKAGTGTQLQINDADLALAQARLNQLNAVYDYSVALAELEQLLGNHVELNSDGTSATYSMR